MGDQSLDARRIARDQESRIAAAAAVGLNAAKNNKQVFQSLTPTLRGGASAGGRLRAQSPTVRGLLSDSTSGATGVGSDLVLSSSWDFRSAAFTISVNQSAVALEPQPRANVSSSRLFCCSRL
jgi:hypothetical protein